MPTELEYTLAKIPSNGRDLYAKFKLLNYNFQTVDELEGVVVDNPSFSINATSDIRRTCNISIYPKDSSFDIANGNKIWLDKYIQIYVGIKDPRTDEIEYTNMGIYLINNPQRAYSATTNVMTIEGVDLMAKMTGLRNGNLEGMTYTITAGSNVRNAIISTIALSGFTKYVVDECTISVPENINIDVGGTVYDILKALRDLLPQYQIYFDVDGIFHYNLIPSGATEQVMMNDDIFDKTLIDYTIATDFESVKNSITVIGKTHDISNYGVATISGSTYLLTISSVSSLVDLTKIGFTAPSAVTNPYINLNSYGAKPLKYEDGTFPTLSATANVYYVAKYQATGDYWLFMGEVTPMATVQETNPDSPFYIGGTMGVVREVLSGGNYDNIYMTSLAKARAQWELYNSARITDNITLTCVPIYWADVNTVIEVTLPNKQGTETTNKYIIKQISTSLGVSGTQTITAMKYYPYYAT